jgi:tripartite-type tricarboxylate transporter receptor subunit TctC
MTKALPRPFPARKAALEACAADAKLKGKEHQIPRENAMRRLALAAFALLSIAAAALADTFPSRPIKIIVPTPPGGPVDVMARLLANALPAEFGQSVVVENKPGAGNIIGSKIAADAPPDGYTLHVSSVSGLILSPLIHKNPGYTTESFAPIALVTETPQLLVVNPNAPFKDIKGLVAYAMEHPGKLNYSSGGVGTFPNLAAELFKMLADVSIVHVPYKGGGLALNAVMAGEADMEFDTLGTSLPLVRAGKLRAVAISGKARSAELPDVPTMDELGFPQLITGAWTALVAPKGTPPDVIAKVNAAANKALHSDAVQGTLQKLGAQALGGSPQDLTRYISAETAKWKPVLEDLHIQAD